MAHTVRWGDDVWIKQSDVEPIGIVRMPAMPVQVRQPGRNGTAVAATSDNENTNPVS